MTPPLSDDQVDDLGRLGFSTAGFSLIFKRDAQERIRAVVRHENIKSSL
jgi:hypothetical protein